MKTIGLLRNTIQNYAWGSPTAIPDLLQEKNPEGKPWAELWMGAHPKAPSLVNWDGHWQSLAECIRNNPHDILGRRTAARFDNRLPYLFKVLAAAKPLSIQVHPNLEQARQGFEKENALNLGLASPLRNYRDNNSKPECICALSEFHALCGFRKISEIIYLMRGACPQSLSRELEMLQARPDAGGLKKFYSQLMTMDSASQFKVLEETLQNIPHIPDPQVTMWIRRLAAEFPSDIGILSPMLLNLICLQPGQALYLPAGELHSYLGGLGIELMANSDNVLRGGLTPKHIDLSELLKVVHFKPRTPPFLETKIRQNNETIYIQPAEEFDLAVISVSPSKSYTSWTDRGAEILLCTGGKARVRDVGAQKDIRMKQGDSAIIPAAVKGYAIEGNAVIYKAGVPC